MERIWEGLNNDAVHTKHEGFFIDYRRIEITASPKSVYQVLTSSAEDMAGFMQTGYGNYAAGWIDDLTGQVCAVEAIPY